ncbi:DUF6037 family protein [Pseudobacillus sp. 179-B 2D1 NHS]|uniref:DUF6037 family protein n=1 Tax=Pseudobacillus sp. 179-B 2D1 NHS TaxID=3374292 RepID=UPI00387918F3
MKLLNLKDLYIFMQKEKIDRYKFDFSFNGVKFDVLYFIDETPHTLSFGIKRYNYYFEVAVNKGFNVKPFIDDYNKFCEIMGFTYNPSNPFKASKFFEEFNNLIPKTFSQNNVPQPHEIAIYRNDVEESEKIYFVKWRDNNKAGHKVSEANLEKTRKLLSYEAYLMCKKKNISSCWSAFSKDRKDFMMPPR